MPKADCKRLIQAALRARKQAFAPYSGFKVGAAVLTSKGRIVSGANIESASFGLSCCAERVTLFKAVSEGIQGFVAMAVVARHQGGPVPCGACRQILFEQAPQALVWVADSAHPGKVRTFEPGELLPTPFTATFLKHGRQSQSGPTRTTERFKVNS